MRVQKFFPGENEGGVTRFPAARPIGPGLSPSWRLIPRSGPTPVCQNEPATWGGHPSFFGYAFRDNVAYSAAFSER